MSSVPAADENGTQARSNRSVRQDRIRETIFAAGSARIDDLAQDLGVSAMTIHRDLADLERQGWISRIRGGAAAHPAARLDTRSRARLAVAVSEKEKMARQALTHVRQGQTVTLDESTSGLRVAQMLPDRSPLTVISNYRAVINALAGEAGIELIGLGGIYHEAYDSFMGHQTIESVEGLRSDLLIMSTTAFTDGALFQHAPETITIKKALMQIAERKILLLDHTKFGKRALHLLAPITDFDLVIVDDGADAKGLEMLEQAGVAYEVAGST